MTDSILENIEKTDKKLKDNEKKVSDNLMNLVEKIKVLESRADSKHDN